MTKEEFLKDPTLMVLRLENPAPAEWIAAAWSDVNFRENVTHALIRCVCKNGDFFVAGYWIEVLPAILSEREVITLFERIRDESGRLEAEWREEFTRVFADHAAALPTEQRDSSLGKRTFRMNWNPPRSVSTSVHNSRC